MARYNKIYAGPFTEATPQVREAVASEEILPGSAIVLTAGEFALSGAAATGKIWIAQDNYLTLKGVDDAWEEGDRAIGMETVDEQFFNVRLADGETVAIGDQLAPGAGGVFTVGDGPLVAEEAYDNDTDESQLVRARAATGVAPEPAAG